jgi:hypothetical protein
MDTAFNPDVFPWARESAGLALKDAPRAIWIVPASLLAMAQGETASIASASGQPFRKSSAKASSNARSCALMHRSIWHSASMTRQMPYGPTTAAPDAHSPEDQAQRKNKIWSQLNIRSSWT